MKLLIVLGLCACAFAASTPETQKIDVALLDSDMHVTPENRNFILDLLTRQLLIRLRNFIQNGSSILNVGPLDPLRFDQYDLNLNLGVFNAALHLKNAEITGISGFVANTFVLSLNDLSLEVDFSFPSIYVTAGEYDFEGDLFNAIPLYGRGSAAFRAENLRLRMKFFVGPSDDGRSAIISSIDNFNFSLPHLESRLTGVIGGGDIDSIINAIIEDVVIDYLNRFSGAINKVLSSTIIDVVNPFLNQLDTWKYIEIFM